MDESSTESKGKARKISIQVAEEPVSIPEPIEPSRKSSVPNKKRLRNAYIYLAIGVVLVVVSSVDIYSPDARGQAAMGLLIVGGLWLAYGVYAYFRAKE